MSYIKKFYPFMSVGAVWCMLPMGTNAQTTVLIEDFDDSTLTYTTSSPERNDNNFDYWARINDQVNAGDHIGDTNPTPISGDFVFGGNDITADGGVRPSTLSFTSLNISGLSGLELSFYVSGNTFSTGSNAGFTTGDVIFFEYQIDGGGFTTLIDIADTGSDGIANVGSSGPNVTTSLVQFTESIAGTGSTLDLNLVWDVAGSSKGTFFDDIQVSGTVIPEPSALTLLILPLSVLFARRKYSVR